MAVLEGGVSGGLVGAGPETGSNPLHVVTKPIPWGALGIYRTSHRHAIVASQAANSRIFEVRNTHPTNLMVLVRLTLKWLQTAAHTAAIEDSLDVFKVTSFSAVDTTNTVTPAVSLMRATMAAVPGFAVRGVTVAGAAAGMTGGTLTKDTAPLAQLPQFLLAAAPTGGTIITQVLDFAPAVANGEHPPVFAQNEGFIIENRALLGAAAGSSVYIDAVLAEVTAY